MKAAKDFRVEQIKRQAGMKYVSLEESEIQMLHFTEQRGLSGKMAELADTFEENYDNAKYEKKFRV